MGTRTYRRSKTSNQDDRPWALALSNPALPGSPLDYQVCLEAPEKIRSLVLSKGRPPGEIVYARTPYKGIMSRNPDLVPMLIDEGYEVMIIECPYPESAHRAALINVHPAYEVVEVIRFE